VSGIKKPSVAFTFETKNENKKIGVHTQSKNDIGMQVGDTKQINKSTIERKTENIPVECGMVSNELRYLNGRGR